MAIQAVWKTFYCFWVVSEFMLLVVMRTRGKASGARDRGSLLVLWLTIAMAITAGDWIGESSTHTPYIFGGALWVRAVSTVMLIAGLTLRLSAVYTLGRSFSVNVAIRTAQKLYTAGLFRVIRHPSYAGLMLICLAIGMHTKSWIGLGIILIFTAAALLYRMRVEERALREVFGSDYTDYAMTTRYRLLPGIY